MNSRVQVSYQPIIDIEFSGLHLIEASAGTGKTYTLSSLMVRIFLEKYLPVKSLQQHSLVLLRLS